jgi:CheY-like chemotaxis protein
MDLATAPSSERTLLVISSDRANLHLMTQLIGARGDLSVQTANKGLDGYVLATTIQPAVVVMDTGLSDTCAKVMLGMLKEHPRTSKIPVIAVSSDAQESQVQAGLNAGFHRYVTKPYKLASLLDAIDDSLRYCLGLKVT